MKVDGYEWCPLYYKEPMQVKYFDSVLQKYEGGIAFHNYIIRGLDGCMVWIPNIVNEARQFGLMDAAVIELKWTNLSKEILGEK